MIHVCAAVICVEERFLLTSRPPGSHLGGKWEFPGGKLKPNETIYACLIREVHEELGVKIVPLDLIYSVHHSYPEKDVYLEFFRAIPANANDFKPVPHDGQKIVWQRQDRLQIIDWVPADLPLSKFLRQSI